MPSADGIEVTLRANVELPSEFAGVEKFGAQGVGLYRSEFLLAHRGVSVSEEVQRAAYEEIARLAGEDGAVIRLFDLGGGMLRDAGAIRCRSRKEILRLVCAPSDSAYETKKLCGRRCGRFCWPQERDDKDRVAYGGRRERCQSGAKPSFMTKQ